MFRDKVINMGIASIGLEFNGMELKKDLNVL